MNESQTSPPDQRNSIVQLAILFESGLAALAVVLGAIFHKHLSDWVDWNWKDVGWGLLATAPMLVGFWIMRRVRHGPLGRLNFVVDRLLIPLFSSCNVVQLALISLSAGFGEELLFRGVLQAVLIHWLGVTAGLIIASAVFGLLHSITPTYAILATAIGVYLGWFALASGNLLGPIVAHAVYDFLALAILTGKFRPHDDPVSPEIENH